MMTGRVTIGTRADWQYRRFWLFNIHSAETFPLILAIGIFIQGLIFAGSQGIGMSSLNADGCSTISQLMFPGKPTRFMKTASADTLSYFYCSIYSTCFRPRMRHSSPSKVSISSSWQIRRCNLCGSDRCWAGCNLDTFTHISHAGSMLCVLDVVRFEIWEKVSDSRLCNYWSPHPLSNHHILSPDEYRHD